MILLFSDWVTFRLQFLKNAGDISSRKYICSDLLAKNELIFKILTLDWENFVVFWRWHSFINAFWMHVKIFLATQYFHSNLWKYEPDPKEEFNDHCFNYCSHSPDWFHWSNFVISATISWSAQIMPMHVEPLKKARDHLLEIYRKS